MKKLSVVFLGFTLASVAFLLDCSGNQETEFARPRPTSHPQTDIRKLEIDQIREGHSVVRVTAVLGQPTVKKQSQEGTEMIWYFTPTTYQKDSFETLKEEPRDTEGHKFLRLLFDSKGIVTQKEFEL